MANPILGLYLHIPFCKQICSYCDFYKLVNLKYKNDFIHALCQDIIHHTGEFNHLVSLYLGGGTPSILAPNDLRLLKKALIQAGVNFTTLKECSFEANPNDINEDYVKVLKEFGVTRVSLGIQSLRSEKLSLMKRSHQALDALKAIEILKSHHFMVNVDLIYGFKDDIFTHLKEEIDLCLEAGCDSFSLYTLILEEKTALYKLWKDNLIDLLSDEDEHQLYYQLHDYLEQNGVYQYEVSNYAKKGCVSLHNLLYWHYQPYLGLGPAASSLVVGQRFTVDNNIIAYNQGNIHYSEILDLSLEEQAQEYVMMGLRLTEGLNIKDFEKRFKKSILEAFPKINQCLIDQTLILKDCYLSIPLRYFYVQNAILTTILDI